MTKHPSFCNCGNHGTLNRREFIRLMGLVSLCLATDRFAFADDLSQAKYYGAFSQLPVGAVQPRGWIQKWLERQAEGLSGHPENMAYPFDTCMYAGIIPPPTVKHGGVWWPYEQSGYYFDATARLSHLIDSPPIWAMALQRGAGPMPWPAAGCWLIYRLQAIPEFLP
jgi:hypothetical protein